MPNLHELRVPKLRFPAPDKVLRIEGLRRLTVSTFLDANNRALYGSYRELELLQLPNLAYFSSSNSASLAVFFGSQNINTLVLHMSWESDCARVLGNLHVLPNLRLLRVPLYALNKVRDAFLTVDRVKIEAHVCHLD